jgi:hypothetical protein
VPQDWTEMSEGVYSRNGLGIVSIILQRARGLSPGALVEWLRTQLGIETDISSNGSIVSASFEWSLYSFEAQGLVFDLAVCRDGTDSLFVMLQSSGDDAGYYFDQVFLPAVSSLQRS